MFGLMDNPTPSPPPGKISTLVWGTNMNVDVFWDGTLRDARPAICRE